MSTALRFVDYFRHYIRAKRVAFDTNWDRTSGEGAYLLGKREHYSGLPIGMATPADCEGIKMEFNYGVAPSSVTGNGKMVHGLDVKMTMDQDWDFTLKPYNATVRGARIQAISQKDVSGRVMGAYINARAEGTYEIEGYISGATGPGMIGIEARTELATSAQITTTSAVGVLIFHRNQQDADIITGGYRGLQVEVPLMGTGASIEGTTYGIYIADEWGGGDDFDCGMCIDDDVCTTGIQIGNCTTGITLDGTMTTGLNIPTGCTTAIQTGADASDGGDVKFYGATTGEICEWDSSAATLKIQSTHTLSGSTPVNILRINNYPTMAASGSTRGLLVLSEALAGTEGAYLVGIAAIAEQDSTLRVHGVMSAICASLISGTDDPQTMCCVEMTYKNTGASSSSSQSYMLLREYSTGTPCCVFLNMPDHDTGSADRMNLFCENGAATTCSHTLRCLVGGNPYWIMLCSTPPA